jgi:hypothetical protein
MEKGEMSTSFGKGTSKNSHCEGVDLDERIILRRILRVKAWEV